MGLLSSLNYSDSALHPYLNTRTLYDIQTGVYVPGTHGGMVLNGGLSFTNAFIGRPQMYKSTVMFSYVMRCMSYYPRSEILTNDTEDSLKKERIVNFSPYNNNQEDLYNRSVIKTPVETTAEEFFECVKKIEAEKLAHRDDYLVKSQMIDPRNSQPLMMMLPTFICYDSWSAMISGAAQSIYDTKQLGSSDTNMVYMRDGNVKKMILSQIPTLAARAGIYFVLSAHVGEKYEMNNYAPSPKSLQYMRASDKPKGVGSDFNFLISNTVDMRAVKVLHNGEKECQYPTENGGGMELNEVISVLCRCKNNMSGTQLSSVVSQSRGILGDLSNYHYLREQDFFGLIGSKINHKPAMTDINLTRTTVRNKLQEPHVARAVELLAQLRYIQRNWMPSTLVDFSISPQELADKLLGSDSPTITDILQSRGYWTYDESNLQPYLSLFDVVAIAQGTYRARGISLSGLNISTVSTDKKKT